MTADMPPRSESNLCDQPIPHDDPLAYLRHRHPACTTAGTHPTAAPDSRLQTHAFSTHTTDKGVAGLSCNHTVSSVSHLASLLNHMVPLSLSSSLSPRHYFIDNRKRDLINATFVTCGSIICTVQSPCMSFSFSRTQGFSPR